MKKFKKWTAFILIAALAISTLSACGKNGNKEDDKTVVTEGNKGDTTNDGADNEEANPYAEHIKFTMSAVDAEKAGLTKDGEVEANFKWLCDKFNVEFDFWPLTWSNYVDQTRMWMNSDSAPDIIMLDIAPVRYSEYLDWVDAGLFRAYPDFSNYKNLEMRYEKMTTGKKFAVDGKLYAWPSYQDSDKYNYVSAIGYNYRKDWAQSVGLWQEDETYTWDEWINLVKTVIEKDPGNNGAGNTIGIIAGNAWEFPRYIIGSVSPYLQTFKQEESGEWVWGPTLPESLEAVKLTKQLYDEGVIWSDQPMVMGDDAGNNFNAGKSFATVINNLNVGGINTIVANFKNANPDINPQDAIGVASIEGPDGKLFTWQGGDQWSQTAMNYKMTDAQADRWVAILDYLVSEEGYYFRTMGIPEVDWKYDSNNEPVVLWTEKDESGNLVNPYSYGTWAWARSAGTMDGFALISPSYPQWIKDMVQEKLEQFSSSDTKVVPMDPDLAFFTNEAYDNATAGLEATIYTKIAELMTSKNIESDWAAWVNQKSVEVQPAVDELNANLK